MPWWEGLALHVVANPNYLAVIIVQHCCGDEDFTSKMDLLSSGTCGRCKSISPKCLIGTQI